MIASRRTVLASAGGLGLIAAAPADVRPASSQDAESIRRFLADWYQAFTGHDRVFYRGFLADEYLLLEHGELLDIEGDMALMPPPGVTRTRRDQFDFKHIFADGDLAWAVYFLDSEISDQTGRRDRRWLESALLRRDGTGWRALLLHSTRIEPAPSPQA